MISIHVPAWGTTNDNDDMSVSYSNFNPRSRVGNDHTSYMQERGTDNFNPRSRVGNDVTDQEWLLRPLHFNPRSRVGNDYFKGLMSHSSVISIHVPAWGTTGLCGIGTSTNSNFNPRSRVGNDGVLISPIIIAEHFNPRSRVGNDIYKFFQTLFILNFNPRSRVGNDP